MAGSVPYPLLQRFLPTATALGFSMIGMTLFREQGGYAVKTKIEIFLDVRFCYDPTVPPATYSTVEGVLAVGEKSLAFRTSCMASCIAPLISRGSHANDELRRRDWFEGN